jgi:hypothetical protein
MPALPATRSTRSIPARSPHFGRDDDARQLEGRAIDAGLAGERIVHREHALLEDPLDGRVSRAHRNLAALEYYGEALVAADDLGAACDGVSGGWPSRRQVVLGGWARQVELVIQHVDRESGRIQHSPHPVRKFREPLAYGRLGPRIRQVRAEFAFLHQRGLEQNAASVAGLLLTTEVMVAEASKEEHDHPSPGGGMGGMGGMDM